MNPLDIQVSLVTEPHGLDEEAETYIKLQQGDFEVDLSHKTYEAFLAGGAEAIFALIELLKENS